MAVTINGTTGITSTGDYDAEDNDKILLGTGDDLQIYHDGSNNRIHSSSHNLYVRTGGQFGVYNGDGTEGIIKGIQDGKVQLYYDGDKRFETDSQSINVFGDEGESCHIYMSADQADDQPDQWRLKVDHAASSFYLQNYAGGNWDHTNIKANGGGAVELYYDNGKRVETKSDGVWVGGPSSCQIHCYTGTTYRGSVYANTSDYIGFLDHSGNWVIQAQRDTETEFHATNIVSDADDAYNVGTSSKRWDNIYATNGTIQTSDRNEKNTIVDSDLGLSFVNKLKPVSYKFNGKTRTHYGLIAQDVETTLSDISKTTTDFAGFIKSDTPEIKWRDKETLPEGKSVGDVRYAAGTKYGLRYTEFIGPLVKAVQELSTEVETLKTKVAALEAS